MKLKPNLKLRKMGSKYMIVNASPESVNLTHVFTLNETAAQLWMRAGQGEFTPEILAQWLSTEYEVSPEVALRDVQRQLDEWQMFGLLA